MKPHSYNWSQSSPSPQKWQRQALSLEGVWAARPKDARELFIYCSIILHNPFPSATTAVQAAKIAWKELHHEVPELRVRSFWENGKAFMGWEAIRNDEEAESFFEGSFVCFQRESEEMSFTNLRGKMQCLLKNGMDVNALLGFHPQLEPTENGAVINCQVILYADHQITDGIGVRILLGKYLAHLASVLKQDLSCKRNWKLGQQKPSNPWITCMGEGQFLLEEHFQDTRRRTKEVVIQKMKENPGLHFRQDKVPLKQETHFITFDSESSRNLLRAIKNKIGHDSNITHLGHAAMVLALLRCTHTSLTPASTLFSPCWLNGRRYLSPGSTRTHVPICMGFAPIIFTNLKDVFITRDLGDIEARRTLVDICKVATKQYWRIKSSDGGALLGACVDLFESLGQEMMSSPLAALDSRIGEKVSADPFFLSDGKVEEHIVRCYPVSSSSPTLTVNDVYFAAAAEQNLIVRMSSWRGELRISGEWRSSEYERDYVVEFLQDMGDIMYSLVA